MSYVVFSPSTLLTQQDNVKFMLMSFPPEITALRKKIDRNRQGENLC